MFSLKVLFSVTVRDLLQIGLYRHLEILPQQIPHVSSEMKLECPPPPPPQYSLLFFLSVSLRKSLFILVNDSVTCMDQLLGGDLVWMDDARKHNLHCAACVVFFMTHTMVPIQPSITCLWAINTWCHRRAVSCFTSVMDGFDTPRAQVEQSCCEADISGGEIAVWSLFEIRCQPKLAARCRFMDRFTSWG